DAQGQRVLSRGHVEIEFLRGTKTVLLTDAFIVEPHGGFAMRALEIEDDMAFGPGGGYPNRLLVPGCPHVIGGWSEPKGDLEIIRAAIFRHSGVEEPRAVVDAGGPAGLCGDGIAFVVLHHGAGKANGFGKGFFEPALRFTFVAGIHAKPPGACEVEGVCGLRDGREEENKYEKRALH